MILVPFLVWTRFIFPTCNETWCLCQRDKPTGNIRNRRLFVAAVWSDVGELFSWSSALTYIICDPWLLPPSFHINKPFHMVSPTVTCSPSTPFSPPIGDRADERCYKKVRGWTELETAFSWRLFFSRSKSEANLLRSSSDFNFLPFVLSFNLAPTALESPVFFLPIECQRFALLSSLSSGNHKALWSFSDELQRTDLPGKSFDTLLCWMHSKWRLLHRSSAFWTIG